MKAGVRQREAMVNISVQVMGGTRKLFLEVAEDITVSECMTWCVAVGRALLLTPHQAEPSGWAAPGRRAAARRRAHVRHQGGTQAEAHCAWVRAAGRGRRGTPGRGRRAAGGHRPPAAAAGRAGASGCASS